MYPNDWERLHLSYSDPLLPAENLWQHTADEKQTNDWVDEWLKEFGRKIDNNVNEWEAKHRKPEPPKSVKTRIRVEFNRDLTYSEREDFRIAFLEYFEDDVAVKFSKGAIVWISNFDDDDSRELFAVVSDYVELNYVNVHPKAVYTEFPRIKV